MLQRLRRSAALYLSVAVMSLGASALLAQDGNQAVWQPPRSANPAPHIGEVNGHRVLFVDGQPFSMLGTEIPWWNLRAGHTQQDLHVYDGLYPKAHALSMNMLKVPIKWSTIEPTKGQYDFSYVDHVLAEARSNHLRLVLDWFGHYASGAGNIYENLTGEMYAPRYIVDDEKTYPRAVDANGVVHHNAISYDSNAIIHRELLAFVAFLNHLKVADPEHTVIAIQLENEISVFGADRHNPALYRNHTAEANRRFKEHHFTDDLKFSAWDLSENWIRLLTKEEHTIDPLPIFLNFVGGTMEPDLVGGAPGEDVKTYLQNCPDLSFIGVNAYFCSDWHGTSCPGTSSAPTAELRNTLGAYAIGRNLPAVTETNSGASAVAQRFAFLALGEFGSPIFTPWSLTMSYPESYQPYVLHDGRFANGADGLKRVYRTLEMALPQILMYAGTDKLGVFEAPAAGENFSASRSINGLEVKVSGARNGQAIVIHPAPRQLLAIGYRASLSLSYPTLTWPQMKNLEVERVHWGKSAWIVDGQTLYGVNQSARQLNVDLSYPQAVLIRLP